MFSPQIFGKIGQNLDFRVPPTQRIFFDRSRGRPPDGQPPGWPHAAQAASRAPVQGLRYGEVVAEGTHVGDGWIKVQGAGERKGGGLPEGGFS